MPFSAELSAKIVEWRRKANSGEWSVQEMREAIETLRQDRVGAHIASTSSRTRKAADAKPVDTDALMAQLLGKADPA